VALNLGIIRKTIISYVDSKVTVTISALRPASGDRINPNEDFTFTLTDKNADASSGGVPLRNIIWHVWVENDTVGKLYVPSSRTAVARSGLSETSQKLTSGNLVREMYLFPVSLLPSRIDQRNYLGVGDTDSISLKGKAGANPDGGNSNIKFRIYADIDLDWLFPKVQDSAIATRILAVITAWVRLNFVMQHQQQTNWCWAAVAASVSAFFNPSTPWTQCLIVNAELGRTDCCVNGSSASCNVPWYLDRALQRTGNFVSWSSGAETLANIENEIDNGRILGVRIGWSGGGGHFVVLEGYNADLNMVAVDDPWYGASDVALATFQTAYMGSGTWTHSYRVKP